METETIFPEGVYLNTVSEKAPDFIKANISIHIEKAVAWLQANKHLADEKGYLKLTGKESKQGKRYFQVDRWVPNKSTEPTTDSTKPAYPQQEGVVPF